MSAFGCDFCEKLEVLNFLPSNQDLGTHSFTVSAALKSPKGACLMPVTKSRQSARASGAGPSAITIPGAESLELPAFRKRNIRKQTSPPSGVPFAYPPHPLPISI